MLTADFILTSTAHLLCCDFLSCVSISQTSLMQDGGVWRIRSTSFDGRYLPQYWLTKKWFCLLIIFLYKNLIFSYNIAVYCNNTLHKTPIKSKWQPLVMEWRTINKHFEMTLNFSAKWSKIFVLGRYRNILEFS